MKMHRWKYCIMWNDSQKIFSKNIDNVKQKVQFDNNSKKVVLKNGFIANHVHMM
jgi:hypothetical protein